MKLNLTTILLISLFASSAAAQSGIRRIGIDAADGLSAAVIVENCQLIHTSQILPLDSDGRLGGATVDEQLDHVVSQLDKVMGACNTTRDRVVKLNAYVKDATTRELVSARLAESFGKDSLPAVSYVATALPLADAVVAIDAVIATEDAASEKLPVLGTLRESQKADWSILPRGDVVYVSGQAEPGELAEATRATLESLVRTLGHMAIDQQQIVAIKCFLQPMSQAVVVDQAIQQFFRDATIPPVSHVEWISGSRPIEIELIASAPPTVREDSVSYSAPPWMSTSPVYSRVATIHGDRRIYVSGLYSTREGNGELQTRDIFRSLGDILGRSGSDMQHLAKATYYVSDDDASSQLNAIRPSIYDPQRPPAASKAVVTGVAATGRSITIDIIAGPAKGVEQSE